jgi:carboxymethylenebutenolidase
MEVFEAGDRAANGHLAIPARASAPAPAVLVLHAWWGLTEVFTGVCDRFADAGFAAFAPDLYDGLTATTVADAEGLANSGDRARRRAIALAALAHLRAHPAVQAGPVGVVGFSMGAAWALFLSALRPDEVAAVVAFYGTTAGVDFAAARARYLGHYADHDPYEPFADVQALEEQIRAAGRDVTFHSYPGTGHWFFEDNRPEAYDGEAANLAWERTLAFLRHALAER